MKTGGREKKFASLLCILLCTFVALFAVGPTALLSVLVFSHDVSSLRKKVFSGYMLSQVRIIRSVINDISSINHLYKCHSC